MGPIGYLPRAPGTWASGAAAVVWWFAWSDSGWIPKLAAILIAMIIGVASSNIAEKELGHDAHSIVIDEVAGQWIALFAASDSLFLVIAGFFLFRVFDILKPYPIMASQKAPGGWGIVVDDVIAGIYTMFLLILGRRLLNG